MAKSFFKQVAEVVAQLPDAASFREAERLEDRKNFGNAYISYRAPHIKMRFVKDRDEIRIDIGPSQQSDWWTLDQLCEALGKAGPKLDFPSNAEALLRNYSDIISALKATTLPQTVTAIEALERKKLDGILSPPQPAK